MKAGHSGNLIQWEGPSMYTEADSVCNTHGYCVLHTIYPHGIPVGYELSVPCERMTDTIQWCEQVKPE